MKFLKKCIWLQSISRDRIWECDLVKVTFYVMITSPIVISMIAIKLIHYNYNQTLSGHAHKFTHNFGRISLCLGAGQSGKIWIFLTFYVILIQSSRDLTESISTTSDLRRKLYMILIKAMVNTQSSLEYGVQKDNSELNTLNFNRMSGHH